MRFFLTILICSYVVMSCNNDASQIGSGFFQDGTLDVVYIDSVTLQVSTVQYDSIPTNEITRLIVGYNNNQDLGKLYTSAYFQVAPENALSLDPKTTTYSRTVLTLNPDGYSQYDTSTYITFNIHQLTQEMEAHEDGYLYNTSKFAFEEQPLGTLSFLPKPNADDSLEISLSDSFGKAIIALAQQDAEVVSDASAFIEEFKGIAVLPDSNSSGAIIGIESTPEIRVYYWDKTTTPSEEKHLTVKGGQNLKFNQVIANRAHTMLSSLSTQTEPLDSDLAAHTAYIQGGTGLAMRIEFPYLKDILIENPNLIITDAVLEFYPVADYSARNAAVAEQLEISIVNNKNSLSAALSNKAELVKDEYLGRDTRYQVDLKTFIMDQLATEEFNHNALLFSFTGDQYRQSVDVLKIGDQKSETKMRLKLYCVITKN